VRPVSGPRSFWAARQGARLSSARAIVVQNADRTKA
jgi:hypothetical protein